MKPLDIFLLVVIVAVLGSPAECWRRRRRRRRACSRVNCQYKYGPWSGCGCNGKQWRKISISRHPSCGGSACPATIHYSACRAPVRHCHYTVGSWSACDCNGKQSRRITIHSQPQCGGASCPRSIETRSCRKPVTNCQYQLGPWSSCDCSGKMRRSVYVFKQPTCGGKACPSNPMTAYCKAPVVHCKYETGSWSQCGCNGKQSRRNYITTMPQCGGRSCPAKVEYQMCPKTICGHGKCEGNSGVCKCMPGYTGPSCYKSCPAGSFGAGCASKCPKECPYDCDPVLGHCRCAPGKTGKYCKQKYYCHPRYRCTSLQTSDPYLQTCFMQMISTKIPKEAYNTCPSTHVNKKCHCFKGCSPILMASSGTCKCQCSGKIDFYISKSICCPKSQG